HKTFAIPHGGGGPGVGPVAVAEHLVPYLPGDPAGAGDGGGRANSAGADGNGQGDASFRSADGIPVAATVFGSAGVLPISYAYIALMGADGLTEATRAAILSANYVAARLREHFPVLFTGETGLVAHECILDLRELTAASGVTAEDVAKRLIDYGFHAPTLAFPVAGTLMVEPTESEDLEEIERFIEAMIAIRGEIDAVVAGAWPLEQSPLRNAPHPAVILAADEWSRPYSREQGAFPVARLRVDKYFPPVSRIDGAYGDRNLVCACPPIEAFEG
ncbi:MAG: glycine dehydrogenase (aminomethyl-transferring), partial [Leucobacter sp.]|nr:glycine dehydrogenase (aminomethyl-transferring) [Leucobacter sp.]